MKTILALLFVAAVAAYTQAEELEYHPQAIMHYLEMEDREMANKVRTVLKMNDAEPKPGKLPTGIPPKFVSTVVVNFNKTISFKQMVKLANFHLSPEIFVLRKVEDSQLKFSSDK